jgi:steroid delta-isomerase
VSALHGSHILRLRAFFEHLQPEDVACMAEIYTEQAFFKDPFNELRGLPAIQRVFAHMFHTLDEPRFVIIDVIAQDQQCFLSWDFLFRMRGSAGERRIHGSSHLRFAADGRVDYHRDYWDAAEQFYEQLPLLGSVLRAIKRRLAVKP